MSRILFTGGGEYTRRYPPGRYTHWQVHPLGKYPPGQVILPVGGRGEVFAQVLPPVNRIFDTCY